MTDHVKTSALEKFALNPEECGRKERDRIRAHVDECVLCREQLHALERMYRMMDEDLGVHPTARDHHEAERILPRGLVSRSAAERSVDAYAGGIEPRGGSLTRRILWVVTRHPYQAGGVVLGLAAGLALLLTVLTPGKDANPAYAEIKNYVLFVYNRESEIIWKKPVPGIPDWTSRTAPSSDNNYPRRYLSVEDVDGDNTNEVLLVGSTLRGEFAEDTLYCFTTNGTLRWRAGVGPMMSFGTSGTSHHIRPLIVDFLVMKRFPGSRPQLFVLANEQIYSPSKLFEVSGKDGTILQTFFNRGGCTMMIHKDIARDGRELLCLGGVNDGFNRGCLAVFDPASVDGHSPVSQGEMTPGDTGGSEMYYLLFPRWKLGDRSGKALYNVVRRIIDTQGSGIDVADNEVMYDPGTKTDVNASLFFSLGPTLSVERVLADDSVIRMSGIMRKQGKINAPLTGKMYSSLKDSVLYWNGDAFEHAPVTNRRFNAMLSASPSH